MNVFIFRDSSSQDTADSSSIPLYFMNGHQRQTLQMKIKSQEKQTTKTVVVNEGNFANSGYQRSVRGCERSFHLCIVEKY